MNSLIMLFLGGLFLTPFYPVREYQVAHRRPEPYVISEQDSESCLTSDSCERVVFFVKNPLPYAVKVVFNCGPEFMDVVARVRAKDIMGVEISQESPGKPRCFMLSWQKDR